MLRLILLLAIVGGLAVFALSNGTPLALTFLGMQTPALPLALWVLGAIAAGVATHLLIVALFRLSNLLAAAEVRSRFRRAERRGTTSTTAPREPSNRPPTRSDADWQDWEGYEQPSQPPQSPGKTKIQEPIDDWEAESSDDWEAEPGAVPRRSPTNPQPTAYPSPPAQAGKTETARPASSNVVDAEFRVIVPPFRPTPEPQPDNADDWFEDDDLETDADRRKRLGF